MGREVVFCFLFFLFCFVFFVFCFFHVLVFACLFFHSLIQSKTIRLFTEFSIPLLKTIDLECQVFSIILAHGWHKKYTCLTTDCYIQDINKSERCLVYINYHTGVWGDHHLRNNISYSAEFDFRIMSEYVPDVQKKGWL